MPTSQDFDQLRDLGLSAQAMEAYKKQLLEGFPSMPLAANCEIGKHIKQFDQAEKAILRENYRKHKEALRIVKFVPASGAASRMFKDLFGYMETGAANAAVERFFYEISKYPFYEALNAQCDVDALVSSVPEGRKSLLRKLLLAEGLNYGELPKGMISFHRYADGHVRTAFEEHFHEAKMYASTNGEAHIHFTIPEETADAVKAHLDALKTCLDVQLDVNFEIETSLQMPQTDTPAIYEEDYSWARLENGKLLFRPAGHGALLANLNVIDADVVFIKNIDNVVPDKLKPATVKYKEVLAGTLLEVQSGLFKYLDQAELESLDRKSCEAFFNKWFMRSVRDLPDDDLITLMNRPLRVCGMVKNEGEPGGGPFLVKEGNGNTSLQIVESAQVDSGNTTQMGILKSASHFNPVDLVVALKNHRGEKFDLLQYRNANTGMVVYKSHQGKPIRALELPGLWNGSMHFWNTVFVEVPIETFNPVKTVFDLARPQHQN